METYSLTITGLSAEVIQKLNERADRRGVDRSVIVREILEQSICHPSNEMTLAEVFAPARKGFEESGMTEEKINELIDTEVKAYRAERKASSTETDER